MVTCGQKDCLFSCAVGSHTRCGKLCENGDGRPAKRWRGEGGSKPHGNFWRLDESTYVGLYSVFSFLCPTGIWEAQHVIPSNLPNSFTALRSELTRLPYACHSFCRSQPEFHSSLTLLPCTTLLSEAFLYLHVEAHKQIRPHHLPLLARCFSIS